MRLFAKLFFRGLAAILPLALTCYFVYWAVVAGGSMLESLFRSFGIRLEPVLAILVSIALVLVVGLLMYSFVARAIYGVVDRVLQRIPVIKSVYGLVADVVRLFGSADNRPFRKVVMLQLPGSSAELIGFVTREKFDDLPAGFAPGDRVAVYLPMSYQLGGFTVVVPRQQVREVAMTAEAAMRWAVTAGVAPPDQP